MSKKRSAVGDCEDGGRSRRRWSWQEKLALVERWCESGMTRAAFCREEGLSYGRFLAWVEEASVEGGQTEFAEVRQLETLGSVEPMEVVAPNGWRVRVGGRVEPEQVAALLELVGRC